MNPLSNAEQMRRCRVNRSAEEKREQKVRTKSWMMNIRANLTPGEKEA